MSCHANKCIACSVAQCANHCDTENYCSLDKIQVGTHEADPTMDQHLPFCMKKAANLFFID